MATLSELTIYRGDSYPTTITLIDKTTQTPVDITGYSFLLTVDKNQDPESSDTNEFQVVGELDVDPTTGKVSFTPTEDNTNLSKGTYYFDIQMTDASGHKRTIHKNKFIITQDITK